MNDDLLRSRIAATDPMHDGVSTNPIDSAEAQSLLEAIVNTQLDQHDTETTESPTQSAHRRRSKWFVPALGIAAAAVIAVGGGTLAIAAPVEHQEAKALVGERPLGIPFFGARCERAVDEHHGSAGAPRLDEEVTHREPSLPGAPMILARRRRSEGLGSTYGG